MSDDQAADVMARFAMPLDEAMSTQRAIRRLRTDPVDDDVLLRCIELALKSPTGGNAQAWEFVVVRDRAKIRAIGRINNAAWQVYGRMVRRRAGDDDKMMRIIDAVQWQADHYDDIPVLVVPCARATAANRPVPIFNAATASFYGSVYPAVQNFLLACRAVGLGACLTTLPLFRPIRLRRILGLPLSVHPVAVIPVGWPRGRYGPTSRPAVGDVVHVDTWGDRPFVGRRIADAPEER